MSLLKQKWALCGVCVWLLVACGETADEPVVRDLPQIVESGELRVITMENSLSYFVAGDEDMGYEYDLARNYADHIGVPVKLIVAHSMDEMKQLLIAGEGDVIAYRYACSRNNREDLAFVNRTMQSYPVLVQRRTVNMVRDVTELAGKTVYSKKNNKYWQRLHNLNAEIGGGISIKAAPDSLSIDRLVMMVSKGEIPMTVADVDLAKMSRMTLRNLDISVQIGLPQAMAWAVHKNAPLLLKSLNEWGDEVVQSRFYKQLYAKYAKSRYYKDIRAQIPKGAISPYDDLFKQYAPQIDWDWRMLASLAFNESHFDTNAVSSAGALGMMQMMPGTGAKYGLDSVTIFQAEPAIAAAVKYIGWLDKIYAPVADHEERIKFILASYNAGPAHILDARALATKYGENPNQWSIAEKYLMLKSEPEYYNDTVCTFGYFRGNHTVRYVNDVFNTYNKYLGNLPIDAGDSNNSPPATSDQE
ncbi:MAG: transglycosylase SLT domain-containing protein [Paludibacteraceae bacterium]